MTAKTDLTSAESNKGAELFDRLSNADHADNWLGAMAHGRADCLKVKKRWGFAEDKYLVVFQPVLDISPVIKKIRYLLDEMWLYKSLPFLEITCRKNVALVINGFSEVFYVIPSETFFLRS